MEIRVLTYFLAAIDAGSITEGARRLRVSQPSVSRQLHALEKELGADLFERGKGPVRLTQAGRRFEPIARDLVLRERGARRVAGLDDPASARLTVVASFTSITRIIAPFTAEHGSGLPIIDALEETPSRIFDRVVEAEADFGISTLLPPLTWESRPLYSAGLMVQVAPRHALYGSDTVRIEELIEFPLILIDRTNPARTVFDDALAEAGLQPTRTTELNSSYMAQAHAASGRGAAIVTNAPSFGLHPVRVMLGRSQVRVRLVAGWDRGHYAAPLIERWLDDFVAWLPGVPDLAPADYPA